MKASFSTCTSMHARGSSCKQHTLAGSSLAQMCPALQPMATAKDISNRAIRPNKTSQSAPLPQQQLHTVQQLQLVREPMHMMPQPRHKIQKPSQVYSRVQQHGTRLAAVTSLAHSSQTCWASAALQLTRCCASTRCTTECQAHMQVSMVVYGS